MKDSTYTQVYDYLVGKYPELTGKDFRRETEAALNLLEALCNRTFEYDTYTETHTVYLSRVFLRAVPIDEVLSVSHEGGEVSFKAVKPLGILFVEVPDGVEVQVTYKGGYDPIPSLVTIALGDLTYFILQSDPHITEGRLGELTFQFTDLPASVKQAVNAYRLVGV